MTEMPSVSAGYNDPISTQFPDTLTCLTNHH